MSIPIDEQTPRPSRPVPRNGCYNPTMNLAQKIIQLRKEKDWNQTELGNAIGITTKHISRYENGKTVPAVAVIKKLAEVFNVSTDYLLFDEAPKENRFHIFDPVYVEFLEKAEALPEEDKRTVRELLQSMILKNQMQTLLESAEQKAGAARRQRPTLRKVAGRR